MRKDSVGQEYEMGTHADGFILFHMSEASVGEIEGGVI